ncbi:hypothetical protein S245_071207, partial [Arachis hypogaea]
MLLFCRTIKQRSTLGSPNLAVAETASQLQWPLSSLPPSLPGPTRVPRLLSH